MMRIVELIVNQVVFDFRERMRYRVSILSDLAIFTLIYVTILLSSPLAANQTNTPDYNFSLLIGYIFWQINSLVLGY